MTYVSWRLNSHIYIHKYGYALLFLVLANHSAPASSLLQFLLKISTLYITQGGNYTLIDSPVRSKINIVNSKRYLKVLREK